MRYFGLGLLILLSISGAALADETAFKRALSRHLMDNTWAIPERLRSKTVQMGVVFSIDRDGRLLNATIDQSSGSAEDDADLLSGLRRMRSFPRVPDELKVPFEIKTSFNLGAQRRVAYVELQWPPTSDTSGPEIAYRSELQHHLRIEPRVLTEEIKSVTEVRSIVTFSIDRDGSLVEAKVTRSIGSKAVDEQTIAWLKSIQPFPKIPAALRAPMKLTAELVFPPKSGWNDDEARRKINGVCRGC
ncbi:TonB family protein [Bradyrhizobium ontarionense]|uniref:TonB family protein n=1 Tax=Bradyrhizobium ontarionense TaxID=2898149 RepID=A0ABY3RJA1_9BRAD|nr:TonB family protein [Bradyrhizobium sp. A19]UFZ07539.1 TonB family protein [Bradyrhizobium sp. A19]